MLQVYTDAAVQGNPGLAGIGFVVIGKNIYKQIAHPLEGLWDNHQAEFQALIVALEWLIDQELTQSLIFLHSDSKTSVDLIQKGFSKNSGFNFYLEKIYALEESFQYLSLEWVSEKNNRGADQLAKQGLQQAIKKNKA